MKKLSNNATIRSCFQLLGMAMALGLVLCSGVLNAAIKQHDIGTGNLIIPGNSTDDYVVTGSTTSHYIEVQLGYHGSITLQDCSISFSGSGIHSPIRIVGKNGQPNDNPLSVVNIILDGNNIIQNNGGGRACIQVDQGTQINISAIDPCDNSSGKLVARQVDAYGGAAIGSLNHYMNSNEPTATATLYNQDGTPTGANGTTAGGNVVISSGTVNARGGHGAGIGGGFCTYYDGMIVIYGGVVEATADFDAAGVGSGCPEGTGVLQVFAPHSAVIALPPAVISAKGAGGSPSGGVGHSLFPELGLAGTKVRVYIGDPSLTSCEIRVYTEDHTPDANIYVDLSQDRDIYRVVTATVDPALLDVNQVFFGTTNASGVYLTTGKLRNSTTFFTDAISLSPSSYGHPYLPKAATLPTGGIVRLDRLMADFMIETSPSTPLNLGYTAAEALENATCVKLVYNDADPIENVRFDLANGSGTDFDNLIFLAADSTTVISAPTSLNQGETYYIIIPIKTGKAAYLFSDVLRVIGVWQGASTSYIRQIVNQIVGDIHTEYICEGGSYWFNGEELTEEGVYSNVTTVTSQCQALSSVEIVNLVINPPITSSFDDKACDEYIWNGLPYLVSGQYEQLLTTIAGCDSIVTLNLTLGKSEHNYIDVLGCGEYVWNDIEYTTSGQYEQLFQTELGCDSLVTMTLDMEYPPLFRIIGDRHPIAGTEEEFTLYEYDLEFDNPLANIDSISWSIGCQNGFDLRPIEGGRKANLYLYAYSQDSIELKAYVYNRCGIEEHSFWFQTTYYGVEENEARVTFDVFPNPSSGEFKLCLHGMNGCANLRVVDFMGIVVLQQEVKCESGTQYVDVDLTSRPNGIYYLMVDHQGKSYVKKCLISR